MAQAAEIREAVQRRKHPQIILITDMGFKIKKADTAPNNWHNSAAFVGIYDKSTSLVIIRNGLFNQRKAIK